MSAKNNGMINKIYAKLKFPFNMLLTQTYSNDYNFFGDERKQILGKKLFSKETRLGVKRTQQNKHFQNFYPICFRKRQQHKNTWNHQ